MRAVLARFPRFFRSIPFQAGLRSRPYIGSSSNYDKIRPLVRIFNQYISLLSEHTNSAKYSDFKESFKEFEAGQENALFDSFGKIVSLLEAYDELALIAPIYVLGLFQRLTKKLYTGLSDSSATQLKVKLGTFSDAVPKLYGSAKSNTKVPRNIQIITYQILRKYFEQNKVTGTLCDIALCNYIAQACFPLVGQCYFDVKAAQVRRITNSGKCYLYMDFEPTDEWVHFLLGEIDQRLTYSLPLYPDSVPKLSFTNLMPPQPEPLIADAKKLVDSAFVERYCKILVLSGSGLGFPRPTETVRVKLAKLMDQTLANAGLHPKRPGLDYFRKLLAYETGFHQACANKIYEQYHAQVLLFLYTYFQSGDFCCGSPIPTAEEWRQAQKDNVNVWDDTFISKQKPVWPFPKGVSQKLNIMNRNDFAPTEE